MANNCWPSVKVLDSIIYKAEDAYFNPEKRKDKLFSIMITALKQHRILQRKVEANLPLGGS